MKKTSAIASARAAIGYKNLTVLINACNLKHVNSWNLWLDDGLNELRVNKIATVHVSNKIITTDIFEKALPFTIYDNSYWVYKLNNYLYMMGNDGILRCSLFEGGQWAGNRKPLTLGLESLMMIIDSLVSKESGDNFGLINNLEKGLEKTICQWIN
jgi:hypothetical protein